MNVRRTWKSLTWLAAIVCGMAMTPASHGAIVYEYVSDQADYTTQTPGSFINVLVYLKETLTGGSTSLITADGKMLGAGMSIVRSATGLPNSPSALVTDGTGVTLNLADFSGPNAIKGANGQGSPTPTDISFSEAIGPPPAQPVGLGNTGGGVSPSIADRVYLGTIKIAAGNMQGTTTFLMRTYDTTFGNTLTNGNFYDLDVTNNGGVGSFVYTGASQKTNAFTVTVLVPEPASMSLLLGAGVFVLARRRRAIAC